MKISPDDVTVADTGTSYINRFRVDNGRCQGTSSSLRLCYCKPFGYTDEEPTLSLFLIKNDIIDNERIKFKRNTELELCVEVPLCGDSLMEACCGSLDYDEIEIENYSGFGVTFANDSLRPLRLNGSYGKYIGKHYEYSNSSFRRNYSVMLGNEGLLLLFTLNIGEFSII